MSASWRSSATSRRGPGRGDGGSPDSGWNSLGVLCELWPPCRAAAHARPLQELTRGLSMVRPVSGKLRRVSAGPEVCLDDRAHQRWPFAANWAYPARRAHPRSQTFSSRCEWLAVCSLTQRAAVDQLWQLILHPVISNWRGRLIRHRLVLGRSGDRHLGASHLCVIEATSGVIFWRPLSHTHISPTLLTAY